ncbi:uncharacterized protein [Palaemon carinicauda]|uniref:uncharacterized protein n=1 Tax=Palaemon carinicauda TaxID=392227 RepID=UPI0035B59091
MPRYVRTNIADAAAAGNENEGAVGYSDVNEEYRREQRTAGTWTSIGTLDLIPTALGTGAGGSGIESEVVGTCPIYPDGRLGIWSFFSVTSPLHLITFTSSREMSLDHHYLPHKEGTCSLFGSGVSRAGHIYIYQYDLFPLDDTIEEMAERKPTTASQAYSLYDLPEDAVDGSLIDADAYFSLPLDKPWWQVFLGEERLIYQIQIFPRQVYYRRFHNVEVRVGNTAIHDGNFTSFSLLCTYMKIYELGEGHLMCSRYKGVFGRYISIQITATTAEYLQLNEVSVYGLKK